MVKIHWLGFTIGLHFWFQITESKINEFPVSLHLFVVKFLPINFSVFSSFRDLLFPGMLSFSLRWSTRVVLKLPTSWLPPFWCTLLSLDGMDELDGMAAASEQIPPPHTMGLWRFRTFGFLYGLSLFKATKTPALLGHWKNRLPKVLPSFSPWVL